MVIMGEGIKINNPIDIIRYIFDHNKPTTVHMKDWDSGPAGMIPIVKGVLNGLLI